MNAIDHIQRNIPISGLLEKTEKIGEANGFGEQIKKTLSEVNALQLNAGELAERFANGEIEDIHDVMIAAEKSSVSLELVLEVRNKLVEAYREIMRMQM